MFRFCAVLFFVFALLLCVCADSAEAQSVNVQVNNARRGFVPLFNRRNQVVVNNFNGGGFNASAFRVNNFNNGFRVQSFGGCNGFVPSGFNSFNVQSFGGGCGGFNRVQSFQSFGF